MIAYTMVGTRDLDRSLRFYDPLFSEMGWDRFAVRLLMKSG
ncbi:hypothetical protein [Eilatimonas milleporae]|uniref:Uncharacterized protein n=1 Tax=Eilatimonas milleporae TaxID=911205 RepID=A0A3M0CGE9_9PROT|nr:hypothetical protein [Eilatimonas milleporae]RMB08681.1 hypothetical protein BXY39_1317 [Eilatimonas milleporae]